MNLKNHFQVTVAVPAIVAVPVVVAVAVVVVELHLHVPDDATLWLCEKCDVTHKFGSTGWCRVSRSIFSLKY